MAQINIRKEYADGEVLLASDLDAIVDDIESFLNITKINDDNIQDGGIDATAKLADSSVSTAKLANSAVTTAKIADNAITNAKIADGTLTSIKITDANITTAKIADNAITYAKLAATTVSTIKTLSSQTLTGSGNFTVPSNIYTLYVEQLGGDKSFNGLTFNNVIEVTRITATTPAASIAYNALAGSIIVWY